MTGNKKCRWTNPIVKTPLNNPKSCRASTLALPAEINNVI